MPVTSVLLVLAAIWAVVMLLVVCACRAARDGDAQIVASDPGRHPAQQTAPLSWSRRPTCTRDVVAQRTRPSR
jgi:hypothetical protein